MPSRLRKIVSALTLVTSSLSYLSNSLERMKKPAKKLFTFRVLVLFHFCLEACFVGATFKSYSWQKDMKEKSNWDEIKHNSNLLSAFSIHLRQHFLLEPCMPVNLSRSLMLIDDLDPAPARRFPKYCKMYHPKFISKSYQDKCYLSRMLLSLDSSRVSLIHFIKSRDT